MFFTFLNFTEEILVLNYNWKSFFFLVPNCPFYYVGTKLSWCQIVRFYYVGAKLSGCQIVRCQIVLVPNCPGAKLSYNRLKRRNRQCHRPTICTLFCICFGK